MGFFCVSAPSISFGTRGLLSGNGQNVCASQTNPMRRRPGESTRSWYSPSMAWPMASTRLTPLTAALVAVLASVLPICSQNWSRFFAKASATSATRSSCSFFPLCASAAVTASGMAEQVALIASFCPV